MRRYRITAEREDGGWGEDVARPATLYINANDPDSALRKARWKVLRPTRATAVPWDEGRGVLWRLWRRLINR